MMYYTTLYYTILHYTTLHSTTSYYRGEDAEDRGLRAPEPAARQRELVMHAIVCIICIYIYIYRERER